MIGNLEEAGCAAISSAVKSGTITAAAVTEAAIARIGKTDNSFNCFTAVLAERALAEAAEVDRKISQGEDPGPLAGVPFAVKNLFDIKGIPTLAGSVIRTGASCPARDAASVVSLNAAGAVLVGALNMDEFAYGFTTENSHYGNTLNPHDPACVAGGSSGGSAAAVAAGMVPLTVGSDTNGSIRVPSSFCGIFGLKPTYGRLSRRGAFLFAGSLDHVGPFARSPEDLAAAYDAMQGPDPEDPVCTQRPIEPCLNELKHGIGGLRIAVAGGHFAVADAVQANQAVAAVARSLGTDRVIELPEAARARAAAYIITASEGGNHHLNDLRIQADKFDPNTRSRFLAGTLVPAAWVNFAQRFRSWYREQMRDVFAQVDVVLAPATPCAAIRVGQGTIRLGGQDVPSRANIGVFTQPISFVGLPVVAVPVHFPGQLPIAVQLIGAPYQEAKLLRVAWELWNAGVVSAPVAHLAGAIR
jgi:AtzE family amidohydrolase